MLAVLNVSFGESTVTSVWFWLLDGGEASSIKSLLPLPPRPLIP